MIYRLAISGSSGTKVGPTPLTGSKDVVQFWVQGKRLIGPDAGLADVGLYNYPAGGSPTKTIVGRSRCFLPCLRVGGRSRLVPAYTPPPTSMATSLLFMNRKPK